MEEHSWRDAAERYFPDVAAALAEAHAAAHAAAAGAPPPRAAEWKAAYKVLTHVPRAALHGALVDANAVASMRGTHGAVFTLPGWARRLQNAHEEDEEGRFHRLDDDDSSVVGSRVL